MTAINDIADGVYRLSECRLAVSDRQWPFARENAYAAERHFRQASEAKPALFNGRVYVMTSGSLDGGILAGEFMATDFASYLYWRDSGFEAAHGKDAFGSAIVEASDGSILLGRAAPHTMNEGRAYLPGGFIDPIDIGFDATVDIDASIARELVEETGLDLASQLSRSPGYLLTVQGPLVSIGVHYRANGAGDALVAQIKATLAEQNPPELAEIVAVGRNVVTDGAALAALGVAPFTQRLLSALARGD